MTKTSKLTIMAAAAAALLLGSTGAAQAELERVRVAHPNGPATYILRETAPRSSGTTVAFLVNDQGVSRNSYAAPAKADEPRRVVIHQGRGQSQSVPVAER